MNDIDKLRVILPHWIEHNNGHAEEFAKWSDDLSSAGEPEIAGLLKKAEGFLQNADSVLKQALDKAGGAVEGGHHDHPPHHHSH